MMALPLGANLVHLVHLVYLQVQQLPVPASRAMIPAQLLRRFCLHCFSQ